MKNDSKPLVLIDIATEAIYIVILHFGLTYMY